MSGDFRGLGDDNRWGAGVVAYSPWGVLCPGWYLKVKWEMGLLLNLFFAAQLG